MITWQFETSNNEISPLWRRLAISEAINLNNRPAWNYSNKVNLNGGWLCTFGTANGDNKANTKD